MPLKPTNPTKPAESTTPDKPAKPNGNKPNTGDSSNTAVWEKLLLLSAVAVVGTLYFIQKKKS